MSERLAVLDIRSATYLVTADEVIPLQGALLGWNHEEAREEFHARATAHLRDLELPSGDWLSEVAGLGARLYRLTSLDGSTWTPLFEGIIHEWEPGDGDVTITASDPLLWFSANDDQVKYPAGQTCADVLKDLLGAYGLPIGTLAGPSASLPAIVFDGKDGDLALKVLQHGLSQGDKAYVLRWKPGNVTPDGHIQRGAVEVIAPGLNDPIFGFSEGRNVLAAVERQSAADMIQEVVVVGNQGDDAARPPIESRIRSDDARLLGGRAILKSADYDTPEAVKKAAETLLQERGRPARERSATVVDVPTVRKGDVIRFGARTLDGYYTIASVSHDADERTMDVTLIDRGAALYSAQVYPDPVAAGGAGGSACGTEKLLAYARTYLGTPYQFGGGGSGPGQPMDCSRFVQLAFASIGVTLGRSTLAQRPQTTPVATGQQQAGDLAFYSTGSGDQDRHVAIVLEDGESVISETPPGVKVNRYSDFKGFLGFGRVPGLATVNAGCLEAAAAVPSRGLGSGAVSAYGFSNVPADLVEAVNRIFPASARAAAIAVSNCETVGWTKFLNPGTAAVPEYSVGYFQINVNAHGKTRDYWMVTENNVLKAYELWRGAGGSFRQDWVNCSARLSL